MCWRRWTWSLWEQRESSRAEGSSTRCVPFAAPDKTQTPGSWIHRSDQVCVNTGQVYVSNRIQSVCVCVFFPRSAPIRWLCAPRLTTSPSTSLQKVLNLFVCIRWTNRTCPISLRCGFLILCVVFLFFFNDFPSDLCFLPRTVQSRHPEEHPEPVGGAPGHRLHAPLPHHPALHRPGGPHPVGRQRRTHQTVFITASLR